MSKYLEESYSEALKENVELLAKLKIAEKALEACKGYDEYANCHWCGGKIKEITSEALQQLRK